MKFFDLFKSEKYRWVKKKTYYGRICKLCKVRKAATLEFYKFPECGHIVHRDCYKKYHDNKCPRCGTIIYQKQKSKYVELDEK